MISGLPSVTDIDSLQPKQQGHEAQVHVKHQHKTVSNGRVQDLGSMSHVVSQHVHMITPSPQPFESSKKVSFTTPRSLSLSSDHGDQQGDHLGQQRDETTLSHDQVGVLSRVGSFWASSDEPQRVHSGRVKVLVRENRIAVGLISETKGQQDVMTTINHAKLDQLKEMCLERGIPLWEKARVGDLRLHLKQWIIQNGTASTTYHYGGRCNGMSFEEIAHTSPDYIKWAIEEVDRSENPGWQLRQLVHWVTRMDVKEEVINQEHAQMLSEKSLEEMNQFVNRTKKIPVAEPNSPVKSAKSKSSQASNASDIKEMKETLQQWVKNMTEMQEEMREAPRKSRSVASTEGYVKVENQK